MTKDACKKSDFCVSVCKTNFTDHHIPDTIHGLVDLVLVCKMHECIQKFSISIPSQQAIQAIAMVYENKPLQNAFKRI